MQAAASWRSRDAAGWGSSTAQRSFGLKRDVALKAIAPELAADPAFHERFRRESQLAASVEHPNVLPIYEAGELDDGSLFLVTRWVDGADLATLLGEHGRMAPPRAAALVAPVALALDSAHRRGLVHRDVKPANILVAAADEHVYLADFGISRALGAQNITRTGMFVGTVAYAAPERLQGDRGAEAADIYSLGCVLFETLAGQPPFVRDTELETMHAHVYDPAPAVGELAPGAPPELEAVVERSLAKDPAQRFASAGEMAVAIAGAAAGASGASGGGTPALRGTTTVVSGGTGSPATTPASEERRRSRRALAIALAVGGVVAAIVLAIELASGNGGSGSAAKSAVAPRIGPVQVTSIDELAVGHRPGAVTTVGDDTAVADPGHGLVRIYHADGHPPTDIPVGGEPDALASDRTGRVWVADAASGTVKVIEPASGRTLKAIPVGSRPSAIAIGNGDAVVVDRGSNDLRRIGLRSLSADGTPVVLPGHGPNAVAVGPGGRAWVASESGDVTVVSGGRAGKPRYVSAPAISIASGGGAWVGTSAGTLVHLDDAGAIVGRPRPLHGGPVRVAQSDDTIWIATQDDARLSSIAALVPRAPVRRRASLSPAEAPAALACAPRRCVVTDSPSRQIVAARWSPTA